MKYTYNNHFVQANLTLLTIWTLFRSRIRCFIRQALKIESKFICFKKIFWFVFAKICWNYNFRPGCSYRIFCWFTFFIKDWKYMQFLSNKTKQLNTWAQREFTDVESCLFKMQFMLGKDFYEVEGLLLKNFILIKIFRLKRYLEPSQLPTIKLFWYKICFCKER